MPDWYFDQERFAHHNAAGEALPGVLFELRKTYQTEGGRVRLVEAQAEVHTRVSLMPHRQSIMDLVDDVAPDPLYASHFLPYGGGVRNGMIWVDRSNGLGVAQPWSCAYTMERDHMREPPRVRMTALPQPAQAALRALVGRA